MAFCHCALTFGPQTVHEDRGQTSHSTHAETHQSKSGRLDKHCTKALMCHRGDLLLLGHV